jgi:hypothetical protein
LFGLELVDAVAWLSVAPTSGTLAVGDSVLMKAYFDASDTAISNHPGDYFGRIEVTATGSPLADSLKIPVRMTVGTGVNVSLISGWNMISNPVTAANDSVLRLFQNSLYPYVFRFAGALGYQQDYTMENGPGFWGKFPGPEIANIAGTPRTLDSVAVSAGWNMVGSISSTVDTSSIVSVPPGIILPGWFGYGVGGYNAVTQIVPGKGYWVKANASGRVVLAAGPAPKAGIVQASGENVLERLNTLTITDNAGNSQRLYFGADEKGGIPGGMYEMPPLPPTGAFDARFASETGGLMVQTHPGVVDDAIEYPIAIQSEAYPLTVSYEIRSGGVTYELVGEGLLAGSGTLKIQNNPAGRLVLKVTSGEQLPTEYALYQNYPNPFNPVTNIKFALPVQSRVVVEVYNILGQRIRTLLNEDKKAGYHVVAWDGTTDHGHSLGTGVYFLKLSANGGPNRSFEEVRKLIMLK